MTTLEFEGDLGEISEQQLDFIASVLEKRGYKDTKIIVEPVGQAGDNYVANVKRIIAEKDGDVFKMVAKVAPSQEVLRQSMNTHQMFYNENYMYTKVLPKFVELEELANIKQEERLRFAAYYGSTIEAPHEIILLEDLKVSDFVMVNRFVSLNNESVKLTLRSFAIYHSLSYALKCQEPETFEEFCRNLANMYEHLILVEAMQLYLDHMEKEVLELLYDYKYKNLVINSVSQIIGCTLKNLEIDRKSPYCVIQQGDPWTNNILFRKNNGKPVECCMIDYQLSNKNTPVADLEYMIFNCTDYETRSKHYHEWIDYYYSELDKRLSYFGLKADSVYPRSQLDKDLHRHGKLSFGVSIMVASVLIREAKDAATFKEAVHNDLSIQEMTDAMMIANLEKGSMERFKHRVEGLIDSFVDLGYIEVNDNEL